MTSGPLCYGESDQTFLGLLHSREKENNQPVGIQQQGLREIFSQSSGLAKSMYALALGENYAVTDPRAALLFLDIASSSLRDQSKIIQAVSYYRAVALTSLGDYQGSIRLCLQHLDDEGLGFGWRRKFYNLMLSNLRFSDSRPQFIEYYSRYLKLFPLEKFQKSWAVHFIDSLGERDFIQKGLPALESMVIQYPHGPESSWALKKVLAQPCRSTGDQRRPSDSIAISEKALVSISRTGDLDEGIRPFVAEILKQSGNRKGAGRVEVLARAKLDDDAIELAQQAIEDSQLSGDQEDNFRIQIELAKSYYKQARHFDADKILLRIRMRYPDRSQDSQVIELQADNYYRIGAYQLALENYRQLAVRHPKNLHFGWRAFLSAYFDRNYVTALELLSTLSARGSIDGENGVDVKFWAAKIAKLKSSNSSTSGLQDIYLNQGDGFYGLAAFIEGGQSISPLKNPSIHTKATTNSNGVPILSAIEDKLSIDLGVVELFLSLGMVDAAKTHMAGLAWNDRDEDEAIVLGQFAFAVENFRAGFRAASRLRWQQMPKPKSILELIQHQSAEPMWQLVYPYAYRSDVSSFSKALDLDPHFILAIMRAESHFNPDARSPVGARGLMQLMPATAIRIGRIIGDTRLVVSGLAVPRLSIGYGAFYLKKLLRYYGGNYGLAAAAYNAGPIAVNSWLESCSNCTFFEFVEFIPYLETRQYVKKILKNLVSYRSIYGGQPFSARDLEMPVSLPDGEDLF